MQILNTLKRVINFLQLPFSFFFKKRKEALSKTASFEANKNTFLTFAFMENAPLLNLFHSNINGLTDQEAEVIRQTLPHKPQQKSSIFILFGHLWSCYCNPFNLLLSCLAFITYKTHDIAGVSIIFLMVALSTILRFVQERKSNQAADKLKAMVTTTATVIRRLISQQELKTLNFSQHKVEKKANELVPGDIIHLSSGDMIPTDLRILSCTDLFINQSTLTGESLPVEKKITTKKTQNIFDLDNICYMGTNVLSGTALGLVLSTPETSYVSTLHHRLRDSKKTPPPLHKNITQLSWILVQFTLVMVPLIFLINAITKQNWGEAFLFAVSVAVGLTPEMLPMIVTATLAKGALELSRKKVIVKQLEAIHSFGAMTVLCTDKTGTLTQNKIFLERHTDAWGHLSDLVLDYAYLNSFHQTGLKNLLDVAILNHIDLHQKLKPTSNYEKIDEIPFDFVRRRMSVIVKDQELNHILICKGAAEEVVRICSTVYHQGSSLALTTPLKEDILKLTHQMNLEGLRIIAVARKILMATDKYNPHILPTENNLELLGYIAFFDPPKESTAPALEFLTQQGVEVKILTGDNEHVTQKICQDVGLSFTKVLLGHEIDVLSDEELTIKAASIQVFAKLSPLQKERIVHLLKASGKVVGFMGDGINDANALQAADIGISVDSAVDVAKESADIIMLEKNLMVLANGIMEGRRTFANLVKYTKMALSSNFGNVLTLLITSFFLPFLPLLPLQILIQNLLYDASQISIPWDHVDQEALTQPCKWDQPGLIRFMGVFGPLSSLFDLITLSVLWFVFQANTPEQQSFFQTGFFLEGLITQILIIHLIRSPYPLLRKSHPSAPLLFTTFSMIFIGILLPVSPWATVLGFTAVSQHFCVWLGGIILGYMITVQLAKNIYQRHWRW